MSERELIFASFDKSFLKATLFEPDVHRSSAPYPTVVFLFGGGWMDGTTEQFRQQALAMTAEGYLAITPDYRVLLRDGTTIETAIKDVFYFLRFLNQNSISLGVDPQKIVLCGASAGGHLALCAMMLNQMRYDLTIRGIILFNPVVDTTENGYQSLASTTQDFNPIIYSPMHHIGKSLPPMLIFHGTADTIATYDRAVLFAQKNLAIGNCVELVSYSMREHGFFNDRPDNRHEDYADTLARSISFCKKVLKH